MSEELRNAIGDRSRQGFQIVNPDDWLWEDCVMDDVDQDGIQANADRNLAADYENASTEDM